MQAQTIGAWLGLPPVPVEMPAFGDMKNVEGKTFTPAQLLTSSLFNIENFTPEIDARELHFHSLTWQQATVSDGVVKSDYKGTTPAIAIHAVYAANTEWMSGKLQFNFHGDAEAVSYTHLGVGFILP